MSIRIIPLIVGLAVLLSGYHVENTAIHLEGSKKHTGRMAVRNTSVEDAMLREITMQEGLLGEAMGTWVLEDFYLPRTGFSSRKPAGDYLGEKLEICCEDGKAYILFEDEKYEFRYSRRISDRDIIDFYQLPTSLASPGQEKYMGEGGIYEMEFRAEGSRYFPCLLLNGAGKVYFHLGGEVADGVVFTMEREETGSTDEYPEKEYFESKLGLLQRCVLCNFYQHLAVYRENVGDWNTLEMPSVEEGIYLYANGDGIRMEAGGYTLWLEDIVETGGLYTGWITYKNFDMWGN
ncbi:MAG: hypothetical protein HDR08_09785 [Lachnospiraceae bacterium]|nr:hypothetical protein [Lachnospiraceae bacterium]MBD5511525.1 hypothetical protein [Lachnospiraceae bacterium]